MPKAAEVFTPSDLPTFSYVERSTHKFEERLREAVSIPNMIVSLSGPSKSGKTSLVKKVLDKDELIQVSGASIRAPEDLWSKVLSWMDVPVEVNRTSGSSVRGEAGAKAGGAAGLPLIVKGKAEIEGKIGGESRSETRETFRSGGLDQVIREIGGSSYTLFVDDFHYIPKEVQKDIGRQIKEAAENRVRIITASVPHRSDDVVRSNTELRGRVTAIDTDYWTASELEQIGFRGFRELNIDLSPSVMQNFTTEAFGSPQLMQAIALNFCFENRIYDSLPEQTRIEVDSPMIHNVLERTTTLTDFSSMLSVLHAGPKKRGAERKIFTFVDGTRGDVYRCVLLAMKADPPKLSFPYDEMLARSKAQCVDESPVGSSVAQALVQMDALAKTVQEAPVLEWDEDVLDIVEPYFLFFLRSAPHLTQMAG